MRVENFLLRKGRTFGFKSLMTEPLGQWLSWKDGRTEKVKKKCGVVGW